MRKAHLLHLRKPHWFEKTDNIYYVMEMGHHTWLFLYKGTQKCVVARILPDRIGIYGTLELSKLQEYLPEDVYYLDDRDDYTDKLSEHEQKVLEPVFIDYLFG